LSAGPALSIQAGAAPAGAEQDKDFGRLIMAKKTVADIDVAGKRVLMRVDFNVPVKNGKVTDDTRIVEAVPTIKNITDRGGRLVLMSHLGRPKGERTPEYSLKPAADVLSALLGKDVRFVDDCIGEKVEKAVTELKDGDVLVLENLRFYKQEEKNDEEFSKKLAKLGDVYVNDAFGTAHRNHASTYGAPMQMTGPKVIGFLIERELKYLDEAVNNPERPFIGIMGGAKVSDKIEAIDNLLTKVDKLLIGGRMAYTLMKAAGRRTGGSWVEEDKLDLARNLLKQAGDKLVLPPDNVCGKELEEGTPTTVCEGGIDDDWKGFDIGPKTIEQYTAEIKNAKTVIWNGPVGAFEIKPFDKGTMAIAHAIADATGKGATSVIGGGDSAAAVQEAGLKDKVTHVSTGGGASLEFMTGKPFDTLEILDRK